MGLHLLLTNHRHASDSRYLEAPVGREVQCRAKSGGKWHQGKALLETSELIFRGDLRLKIPFASLRSVVAREGKLHLRWDIDSAVFELGPQAEKWAHTILHPKSTVEKLGIKPGQHISAIYMPDDTTMKDARKAAAGFSDARPLKDSDVIFFAASSEPALAGIKKLLPSLASSGALWIVYPKGRKEITELQVLAAGRALGLYDIKVVSYSSTYTALKFVRPKTQSKSGKPKPVTTTQSRS
jgi:hypothetical protein